MPFRTALLCLHTEATLQCVCVCVCVCARLYLIAMTNVCLTQKTNEVKNCHSKKLSWRDLGHQLPSWCNRTVEHEMSWKELYYFLIMFSHIFITLCLKLSDFTPVNTIQIQIPQTALFNNFKAAFVFFFSLKKKLTNCKYITYMWSHYQAFMMCQHTDDFLMDKYCIPKVVVRC